MKNDNAVPDFPVNEPFTLNARGTWPESTHVFDNDSRLALRMAMAAERPLLVRGDPGTGKSQLARAAAEHLGRLFVSEVVHARIEPQDLHWRFDAIARLGEAQRLGASRHPTSDLDQDTGPAEEDPLAPHFFLCPGALWWAFDWASADTCYRKTKHKLQKPEPPDHWTPDRGAVLLIDEIDKAEADLPNSLLEILGNGSFTIPWREEPIGKQALAPKPLVIITTNQERELPAAFVRRCLVLSIELPEEDAALIDWLVKRGRIHFERENHYHESVLKESAEMIVEDRRAAAKLGMTKPGQAEYLDLIKAVFSMERDAKSQSTMLKDLRRFAFKKHSR